MVTGRYLIVRVLIACTCTCKWRNVEASCLALEDTGRNLPHCAGDVQYPINQPYLRDGGHRKDSSIFEILETWAGDLNETLADPERCYAQVREALCRTQFELCVSSAVDGDIERPEDIEYCGHKEFDEEPNANAELISQLATTTGVCDTGAHQIVCGPSPWSSVKVVCVKASACTVKGEVDACPDAALGTVTMHEHECFSTTTQSGCYEYPKGTSGEPPQWQAIFNPFTQQEIRAGGGLGGSACAQKTLDEASSTSQEMSDDQAGKSQTPLPGKDGSGDKPTSATSSHGVYAAVAGLVIVVLVVAVFGSLRCTYKAHPMRMQGPHDLLGCCKIAASSFRTGGRYRRLAFEDDIAYDYEAYELHPPSDGDGIAIDDDEFGEVESEADAIIRQAMESRAGSAPPPTASGLHEPLNS